MRIVWFYCIMVSFVCEIAMVQCMQKNAINRTKKKVVNNYFNNNNSYHKNNEKSDENFQMPFE